MGRELNAEHEAWVAAMFADGCLSGASRGTEYRAGTGPTGEPLPWNDDSTGWRPAAQVVAWCAVCSCGWRGMPVRRGEWTDHDRRTFAPRDDLDEPSEYDDDPYRLNAEITAHFAFVQQWWPEDD